jgi:hypothetical protein
MSVQNQGPGLKQNIQAPAALSVGSLVKKLILKFPELSASQILEIVKLSIDKKGATAGEFSETEILNEARAVALAEEYVKEPRRA